MSIDGVDKAKMERLTRDWLTSAGPSPNMLSRLKSRRDTTLLMKFNALTNLPGDQVLAGIDALYAEPGGSAQ